MTTLSLPGPEYVLPFKVRKALCFELRSFLRRQLYPEMALRARDDSPLNDILQFPDVAGQE